MESPVVLDKPPEYYGNDRGFPFEEEEGSGAWSELAARHPDIAARLRQRPASATWARKRRPSSQDATDDFGENFGGFDRFPFDDIPPEFREHFPSNWNRSRRFGSREEAPPQPPQASPPQTQHTAATQTEGTPPQPAAEPAHPQSPLPQYGLRNTVDLGQRSPADPSLVDAEERSHRSMSAPPDHRVPPDMSAHHPAPSAPTAHPQEPSNVRHIPIFVEGRDEPVINKSEARGTQYAEPPPPPPPHVDRDQYFADDAPASFHHANNFTRAFGGPFNKGYRQGPQPFTQQKAYPQTASAFARGASPQRSQSPKPPQEPFVKVPVHHEHAEPHPKQASPQHKQPPPPQPQREPTPPQAPPKPTANDPITVILNIQTDVLNLMTEVENFKGSKKDKRYLFLDEMLTRNLIKLDNIETDGKENIRLARKEAIKCIQKCIAVLEAKAEKGNSESQTQDVEMKENAENTEATAPENGEVEMKAAQPAEPQAVQEDPKPETEPQKSQESEPAAPQTKPEEPKPSEDKDKTEQLENKPSPKIKIVKKRDSSKDKAPAESAAAKDSNKVQVQAMQVDSKGETEQVMEIDGAASQ